MRTKPFYRVFLEIPLFVRPSRQFIKILRQTDTNSNTHTYKVAHKNKDRQRRRDRSPTHTPQMPLYTPIQHYMSSTTVKKINYIQTSALLHSDRTSNKQTISGHLITVWGIGHSQTVYICRVEQNQTSKFQRMY